MKSPLRSTLFLGLLLARMQSWLSPLLNDSSQSAQPIGRRVPGVDVLAELRRAVGVAAFVLDADGAVGTLLTRPARSKRIPADDVGECHERCGDDEHSCDGDEDGGSRSTFEHELMYRKESYGGPGQNRTDDARLFRPALYH